MLIAMMIKSGLAGTLMSKAGVAELGELFL